MRPLADVPAPGSRAPGQSRRIVLATFGSLGDLHPYIALAQELKSRGHEPVIATSGYYREKVEALGLRFHSVRPDAPPADDLAGFMSRVMDSRRGPRVVIREVFMGSLRETMHDLEEAAQGADVLVSHPLTFPVRLIAETRSIAWASTVLAPFSFFSAFDPPVPPTAAWIRGLRPLGPRFHAGLFHLARRMVRGWSSPYRQLRSELGLPPNGDPLFEGQHAPGLVLALFSGEFARPQPDWPPQSVVTGFCFYDRDSYEDPDLDRLREFLDAGSPPVVFTLGSSAVWAARDFFRTSLEALSRLGERGVLLTGPDRRNSEGLALPSQAAAFSYAPFSQLFPRARAIVHQGGIGTTAQVLRAGKPSVVVPHGFDQFDNAYRLSRLGVGEVVPRSRYRASAIEQALRSLLGDPRVSEEARRLGEAIRRENGPERAAEALEQRLGPGPSAQADHPFFQEGRA